MSRRANARLIDSGRHASQSVASSFYSGAVIDRSTAMQQESVDFWIAIDRGTNNDH